MTPCTAVGAPLGKQPALDGLRAVAILAVMGLHADARLFRGGFFGVDVFFVLSAFLITTLILEEFHAREGRYDFLAFYARRALRLGPALVLWLVVIAGPTAIATDDGGLIVQSTLASIFYIGDFAAAGLFQLSDAHIHVWSLAIEEQFYLLWPVALVWWARRTRGEKRLRALALCFPLVVVVQLVAGHVIHANYVLPTGHLIPIAIGCLAAHLFAYRRLDKTGFARPAVAGISLLILVVVVCGYRAVGVDVGTGYSLVVAAATGALVIHAVGERPSAVRWLLTRRVALWIGRRSYGLYLYHRTLSILVPTLIPGIPLRIAGPLVVAISFGIAELSWRYVELPIMRAGRARLRRAAVTRH